MISVQRPTHSIDNDVPVACVRNSPSESRLKLEGWHREPGRKEVSRRTRWGV